MSDGSSSRRTAERRVAASVPVSVVSVVSGTANLWRVRPGRCVPKRIPELADRQVFRDGLRDHRFIADTDCSNTVRIGHARVSGRSQDLQLQLDALTAADCREVIVETASTRGERPKLRAVLASLKAGDTLVIYKPDRVARSMKELLVLLEA